LEAQLFAYNTELKRTGKLLSRAVESKPNSVAFCHTLRSASFGLELQRYLTMKDSTIVGDLKDVDSLKDIQIQSGTIEVVA